MWLHLWALGATLVLTCIQHSLPLVKILVCSKISASYQLDHSLCVVLALSNYLSSLAWILLRTSINHHFLSYHFLLVCCCTFCLAFWAMFINHAYPFVFCTYCGLGTSYSIWYTWFRFQLNIFIKERWKTCSHIYTIFFLRFTLISLLFSFMELKLKDE